MIRVEKVDPPPNFDFEAQVSTPGQNALLELIGDPQASIRTGRKRKVVANKIDEIPPNNLPSFWTKALPHLCKSYKRICSYLGLRIYPGTGAAEVDHYQPKEKYQHLAYSWDNFRLSCKLANTFKNNFEDVIDPFEVQDGWLGINILTGHVTILVADVSLRDKLKDTIKRLRLNIEPTFVELRLEYINDYIGISDGPHISFEKLERDAPFVAREIERQGKKRS
jgi:hypothetical protein